MQHLVQQHRVEARPIERQVGEIAPHQFEPPGGQVLQPRAGKPQHFRALVQPNYAGGAGCEQFGHAARARADVEQLAEAFIAQHCGQCRFYRTIGNVQAAQAVPFFRMGSKIVFGVRLSALPDRVEMATVSLAVDREGGIVRLARRQQRGQRGLESRRAFGHAAAQEHPATFATTLGKACITQDLDVARHPGLALPKHLRQFPHRQFHAGEQPHDPQAGRIGKGAKGIQQGHATGI